MSTDERVAAFLACTGGGGGASARGVGGAGVWLVMSPRLTRSGTPHGARPWQASSDGGYQSGPASRLASVLSTETHWLAHNPS